MAPPSRKRLPIQKRSRSVPYRQPFTKAVFFGAIFLLSVIALITTIVGFAILQTQTASYFVFTALLVTITTWIVSLFVRRSARCPLCKGTPYFSSDAFKHEKATKLPLLNHGITNVIRTIANQTFRCMYCGQPYDMLKPVSNPLPGNKK